MGLRAVGIVGQTLVPMVIGTLAVVGTGAWLAYQYAADRERELVLARIEGRVAQQAEIESVVFEAEAASLRHCSRLLQGRATYAGPMAELQRDVDGVHRAVVGPVGVFIGPNSVDPTALMARDLLAEMGPMWCEDDQAMAIAVPSEWLVGYGTHYTELVQDLLPDDSILLPVELQLLSEPGTEVRWTPAYMEPTTEEWRVAALRPAEIHGTRCAVIHEVPVADLLHTLTAASTGVTAVVWGPDGKILADSVHGIGGQQVEFEHQELREAIITDGPDVELKELASGDVVGVVRLSLPGWTVATRYDREIVLGPARDAAQLVLLAGLVVVLAQIVILSMVLRSRVRQPLDRLKEDVGRMAAGDQVLGTDMNRSDEIGTLVRAFRDMTEAVRTSEQDLVKAFEQLARSEALYRALFDSAADAVLVLRDGKIMQANASACDLFGHDHDDLVRASVAAMAPTVQADDQPSAKVWSHIIASTDAQVRSWIVLSGRGVERETEVAIGRAASTDGELVVAVIRDVTDRNRMEDQLQQGQKMESLGQLAGGIAHDFNNMLGAMIGTAELLTMQVEDADSRELAELILKTGERASALTNRLLAFARRGRSLSTPINLHEVITDAVALLEASVDRRVNLHVDLQAKAAAAIGDGAALQNALLNLGLNARDAMDGNGDICVSSRLFEPDDAHGDWSNVLPQGPAMLIAVADTGSGMPPEVMQRIFEPFFTTKPTGKGTGLGLAAVYRTVHDHGGALCVASEVGAGTTFRLVIPLTDDDCNFEESRKVQTLTGQGTVLLIDDEELVRTTSRQMLKTLGYDVLQAEDGLAGLQVYVAAADRIDAVLLDMEMPEMRGSEVLQEIKRRNPNMPVILCSGFSRENTTDELKQQGAVAFLNKPFRLAELSRVLADAVTREAI